MITENSTGVSLSTSATSCSNTALTSGFASSLAGSGLGALGTKQGNLMNMGCSLSGGLASLAMGDSFFYGAGIGSTVGAYNHSWRYVRSEDCYYDDEYLDEVIVTGKRPTACSFLRNVNDVCGHTLNGLKPENYKSLLIDASFYCSIRNNELGLQSIETMSKYIKPKYLSKANEISGFLSLAYDGMDIYNSYIADGRSIGYNTTKTTARTISSLVLGVKGAVEGASIGLSLGPLGSIAGGIAGSVCGSFLGTTASDSLVDYFYDIFNF